jgi:hypothetical protein
MDEEWYAKRLNDKDEASELIGYLQTGALDR